MVKKSVLTLSVAAMVSIGSLLPVVPSELTVKASKISELEAEKNLIQQKKSGVDSKLKDAKGRIDQIKKQQSSVRSEIQRLDFAISDAEEKIRQKERDIQRAKDEIKQLPSRDQRTDPPD